MKDVISDKEISNSCEHQFIHFILSQMHVDVLDT